MKRKIVVGFSFALTLILLVGCTTNETNEVDRINQDEKTVKDTIKKNEVEKDEDFIEEVAEEEIIIENNKSTETVIDADTVVDTEGELLTNSPVTLDDIADEVIVALNGRDMTTIDTYVHASKGLLFSPYVNVKPDAIHISKQEIPTLLDSIDVLDWGIYDGIGSPILLTPSDYFDEFLDMSLFLQPDAVFVNEFPEQRGNMINNLIEVFPESLLVEYYHEGTDQYSGMDWESVILVFLQDEAADYYLIAIVRDMWTI